jgi:hypothetical protein
MVTIARRRDRNKTARRWVISPAGLLATEADRTGLPSSWYRMPLMPSAHRLPPPWKAEKIAGGYVVRDANGQAIAYVYSRATETDAMQAKVLTEDEARRVAINIARLPELVGRKE